MSNFLIQHIKTVIIIKKIHILGKFFEYRLINSIKLIRFASSNLFMNLEGTSKKLKIYLFIYLFF